MRRGWPASRARASRCGLTIHSSRSHFVARLNSGVRPHKARISMTTKTLAARAISLRDVRPDGALTSPRSFGVYELPQAATGTRRFRLGNHPVRMRELAREFGTCKLVYLFLQRPDAVGMASSLNGREA